MAAEHSPGRPNVIWIFGDQHRAQALSCNGDPNVNTPHIDALAQTSGINFEAAVSGTPLCCPFRGSMLTGLYPHHAVPGHEYRLDPEQKTIAAVFNENGYDTAYFGKWHVDGFHEQEGRAAFHIIPPERRGGFKTWIGYENNNAQYDCWVHGGEGSDAFHYRLPGYETDELTNLLIEYLEDRSAGPDGESKEPFFAALSVQPPHDPYVSPPEFMGRHNPAAIEMRANVPRNHPQMDHWRRELAGAYGQIENLDWNVGRIVDALRKTGLYWNTRIVFFSDHGDMHGSHGQSRKTTIHEESIRIPFIVHDPGQTYYRQRRVDVPINHVDIAPTTLGLCGIEAPDWMEGWDYSHYLTGGRGNRGPAQGEPDSAFLQSVIPTGHGMSVNKPWRAVVTRDGWKYACFDGMDWLMFNLHDDPYELCNLAHNNSYRAERERLKERLRRWIADTGDEFSVPGEPE